MGAGEGGADPGPGGGGQGRPWPHACAAVSRSGPGPSPHPTLLQDPWLSLGNSPLMTAEREGDRQRSMQVPAGPGPVFESLSPAHPSVNPEVHGPQGALNLKPHPWQTSYGRGLCATHLPHEATAWPCGWLGEGEAGVWCSDSACVLPAAARPAEHVGARPCSVLWGPPSPLLD